MANDLYSGKLGVIAAVAGVLFFFGAFYFQNLFVRNSIWIIFFILFVFFNFVNYKITGKQKYLISGGVFLLAGAVGAVNIFVREFISWRAIWLISITLFVLSVPIASLFRSLGILKEGNQKP